MPYMDQIATIACFCSPLLCLVTSLLFACKVAVNQTIKLLVIMFLILFVVLLRIGQGLSQCYVRADCTGSTVTASTARGCCAATNDGLSFQSNGVCSTCVGGFLVFVVGTLLICVFLQVMVSRIRHTICKRVRD